MSIFLVLLLFLLGIVLIIKGGDLFVDAAAWIAEISGIPKLIIGATIVSFATTLPEMLVSVFAAVDGAFGSAPQVDAEATVDFVFRRNAFRHNFISILLFLSRYAGCKIRRRGGKAVRVFGNRIERCTKKAVLSMIICGF